MPVYGAHVARIGLAVVWYLLLVSPSAASAGPPAPESADEPARVEALVTRAIDGDSLDAHIAGRRAAVGFLGVETPPGNTPCGERALARTRELAGSRVLLESDPAYTMDELYRELFYAYTPEGLSLDETLIHEGLGRAVRTDAHHGMYLSEVEAEAAAAGRGCVWEGSASDESVFRLAAVLPPAS